MDKVEINLNNIEAVIFDMDGTMINNMAYHKKAWREFFNRHDFSFSDEEFKQKISGKKNNQIFTEVFNKPLSLEEIQKFTEEKESIYRQLYAPEIKEIQGLSSILQILKNKNLPLAIATTAPEKNRIFGLKALGLDGVFEVILGDEHVSKGKPDPEIYLETAKKLNVRPENCLVFEDTPFGVESGKSAGMTVVGLLSTHTKEELEKADYLINDYSEINFS